MSSFPRMWAAEIWFLRLIAYSQIFRTRWGNPIKCDVPIFLMHWIAIVLSGMTLMCPSLAFTNDFRASKIGFSQGH